MTDSRKRRVHLPEFKAKVVLEAVRGVKTINEIAQDYGAHPVQVSQWKREIQDQAKSLFEGKRGPQPVSAHSAPDGLYGEIGRLKMELDLSCVWGPLHLSIQRSSYKSTMLDA